MDIAYLITATGVAVAFIALALLARAQRGFEFLRQRVRALDFASHVRWGVVPLNRLREGVIANAKHALDPWGILNPGVLIDPAS